MKITEVSEPEFEWTAGTQRNWNRTEPNIQMIFDDDLKDDPRDVDTLLSNELMRLSMTDRNAIQEEIHGVRCLAPEETPQLLQSSLRQLALELDRNLPRELTRAYRQSQLVPTTYVNTLGFRLRFLRCELFDVPKAARRMASFLNMAQDFFGDYALERPIRLSDMNKEELKYMRSGRVQWLPFRDRSGRRIVVIFPGMDMATIPMKIKVRSRLHDAAGDVDGRNPVELTRVRFCGLLVSNNNSKK